MTSPDVPRPLTDAAQLRECPGCGHQGSDEDASETIAWCSNCQSSVPMPEPDICPSCHAEGGMGLACPECDDDYIGVSFYGELDPNSPDEPPAARSAFPGPTFDPPIAWTESFGGSHPRAKGHKAGQP